MMIDFAKRAYDGTFPLDPIVRSLLDDDFYKFLGAAFIWERYPNVQVKWSVTNRTKTIRLVEEIDIEALREQLNHARTLRFTPSEIIWLRGQTFYGRQGIFGEGFLNMLSSFRLPEYHLAYEIDKHGDRTGQFLLTFEGLWWQVTLWEIHALAIINELRSRALMKRMNKSQIDITYARAKVKLYAKLEKLAAIPSLNLTDFGTRRRHSFLWQEHAVLTAKEVLGDGFTGTSNVHLAMKHGFEAKGTSAHEIPMVFTAIARQRDGNNIEAVSDAQYDVLRQWQNHYHQNLLVFLPDTYGTTQFLKNSPQWVANWIGARPDSKNAYEGGEELIRFWSTHCGLTPEEARKKLIIFSDGLDVALDGESNGEDIVALHEHFHNQINVGFGWGTNFTNDFIDCCPFDGNLLRSISLVCKIKEVNGHGAVKLSDNYEKATGVPKDIDHYRKIFGTEGVSNLPVLV